MISSTPGILARVLHRLPSGEILRFGITGIIATLTHFGVLTLGVELFGYAPTPSNGVAFVCAVCVTYLGQSFWVFRVPAHSLRQVLNFMISAGAGFAANIAIMALVTGVLDLHYHIGFAIVTVLIPLCTFVANKFWVFAHGTYK